jgi:hypothetical protein
VASNREVVEDGVNGFIAEALPRPSVQKSNGASLGTRDDWEKMGQNAAKAIKGSCALMILPAILRKDGRTGDIKHAVRASSDR